jgi:xanthine dehydrogenase accessory factor
MDDVLAKAEEWRAAGEEVALATVVATRRSAPRPLGSKLAVTRSGRLYGSVSGGCVEADVAERCQAVLDGELPSVVSYGIEDDEAWTVGLPCGGEIDVFLEPYAGAPDIERGTSYVVVEGEDAGRRWTKDERVQTGLRENVFAEAVGPPPRLVAVGAGDIAEALCALAKPLGWRTIVVDPRAGLANRERVPSADEILVAWPEDAFAQVRPDVGTAVVVLTHDDKFDVPALKAALASEAFYVGALGSRRNQERRRGRLLEAGIEESALDRIAGPSGLDIGAASSAETALSMLAEMLATRAGRAGGSLRDSKSRIHAEPLAGKK